MYDNLVNQLAEQEGITEQLKANDMMAWVQAMNNITNRARNVVNQIIVFNQTKKKAVFCLLFYQFKC